MIIFGPSLAGFLEAILWVFAAMIPVWLTAIYGPLTESYAFPVETNIKLERVEVGDIQYRYYNLTFNKNRSCDPVSDSMAWYGVDSNDVQERLYFEPPSKVNDPKPVGDPSRPIGKNKSGYWRVDTFGKEYKDYKLVFFHDCHPLWRTRTEVEIPVK